MPLMRPARGASLGKNDDCGIQSPHVHNMKPGGGTRQAAVRSYKSERRSVCRFPSGSQRQSGMAHHTSHGDILAHAAPEPTLRPRKTRNERVNTCLQSVSSGFVTSWHPNLGIREELLTGRHGEVHLQWRWAPRTVTMPPHGLGIALRRLGSQGWLSASAGTWAVPSQCRLVDGEAVHPGSSIGRTRDRDQGQQTALRAHFLWAESELRQDTARFESVRCCVPGQGLRRPLMAGSGRERLYETQH